MNIILIMGIIGGAISLLSMWVMVFAKQFYLDYEKKVDNIVSIGVALVIMATIIMLFSIIIC